MNDRAPLPQDRSRDHAVPVRAGALLGPAAVVIWNDVTEEGRAQFYDWHDKEHIPERLALPGFRRGRRYARPGHSPQWLTIYEAEGVEALTSPAYLERLNTPTPLTRATLPYFRNTSRAVCRIAGSIGGSSGGHMLALRFDAPEGSGDRVRRLFAEELFPAALALPGVVACHLGMADRDASFIDTAESRTRRFDVPAWVVLGEATTAAAAEGLHALIDGAGLRALGAVVRPDAAVYALEIARLAQPAGHP